MSTSAMCRVQHLCLLVAVTMVCYVAGQEPNPGQSPTVEPGSGYGGRYPCQCGMPQEQLCTASTRANYVVTFNFNWTEPSPKGVLGEGQSWSLTQLASHSACSVLWRNGFPASQGMRAMAEHGIARTLGHERDLLRTLTSIKVSDLVIGAGRISAVVSFDRNHPVMSSLTFMKPSPDWFVGLDSVNLCRGDEWLPTATFDLKPWDAGVKDGRTFTTYESNTLFNGVAPISADSLQLSTSFRGFTGSLGTVTMRRFSTPPFEGAVEQCPSCAQTCHRRHADFHCPANERWSSSTPQCEVACYGPRRCDKPAKPGCECLPGFVRATSSINSPCVRDTSCRSESNPSLSDSCGVNNATRPECSGPPPAMDRYEVCTNRYSRSCTSLRCGEVMCRCPDGYIRDASGNCLERRLGDPDIPTLPPLNCSIAKKEVVGTLDNSCDFSCETKEPSACHSNPGQHCVCAPNLFRHSVTGECVYSSQCSAERTVAPPTEAQTAAPLARPDTCPAVLQCAHYNQMGTGEGSARCCPTCRQTISRCAGLTCPAIPGCLRYGTDSDGTCCLPCIKRRKKYNNGVCSGVICPSGQTCTNRGGKAMCMCKPRCSTRSVPITGRDGVEYTNGCHLHQAACLQCANLLP